MDNKTASSIVLVVVAIAAAIYLSTQLRATNEHLIDVYATPTPIFETGSVVKRNIPVLIRGSFVSKWTEINPSSLIDATGNMLFAVKENDSPTFR